MYWSYSSSKIFRRCPRQWFYHETYANALSKNPGRMYAYALKKMTTVSQWRGQLVDTVLTKHLVPSLAGNRPKTLLELKREAARLFDRQLAFARTHPIGQPGFRPRDAGDDFAAFHALEYGLTVTDEEIATARREVELALENLFLMDALRAELNGAQTRQAQRSLRMPCQGMNVRGIPDLVLYRASGAPTIIDWKVHSEGERDAWNQLGIYALLLARERGLADERGQIRLLEVQLLRGEIREHHLDTADFEELEDFIADSVQNMLFARSGNEDGDNTDALDARAFPPAHFPETCQHCNFRRICWASPN